MSEGSVKRQSQTQTQTQTKQSKVVKGDVRQGMTSHEVE